MLVYVLFLGRIPRRDHLASSDDALNIRAPFPAGPSFRNRYIATGTGAFPILNVTVKTSVTDYWRALNLVFPVFQLPPGPTL